MGVSVNQMSAEGQGGPDILELKFRRAFESKGVYLVCPKRKWIGYFQIFFRDHKFVNLAFK